MHYQKWINQIIAFIRAYCLQQIRKLKERPFLAANTSSISYYFSVLHSRTQKLNIWMIEDNLMSVFRSGCLVIRNSSTSHP